MKQLCTAIVCAGLLAACGSNSDEPVDQKPTPIETEVESFTLTFEGNEYVDTIIVSGNMPEGDLANDPAYDSEAAQDTVRSIKGDNYRLVFTVPYELEGLYSYTNSDLTTVEGDLHRFKLLGPDEWQYTTDVRNERSDCEYYGTLASTPCGDGAFRSTEFMAGKLDEFVFAQCYGTNVEQCDEIMKFVQITRIDTTPNMSPIEPSYQPKQPSTLPVNENFTITIDTNGLNKLEQPRIVTGTKPVNATINSNQSGNTKTIDGNNYTLSFIVPYETIGDTYPSSLTIINGSKLVNLHRYKSREPNELNDWYYTTEVSREDCMGMGLQPIPAPCGSGIVQDDQPKAHLVAKCSGSDIDKCDEIMKTVEISVK